MSKKRRSPRYDGYVRRKSGFETRGPWLVGKAAQWLEAGFGFRVSDNAQRLHLLCDCVLHKRGEAEVSKLPQTAASPHGQYEEGQWSLTGFPTVLTLLLRAYLPRPPGLEGPSKAVVLRRAGGQCPLGALAMSRDISDGHKWGRCCWRPVGRRQACGCHLPVHRPCPRPRTIGRAGQNTSS